MNNKERYQYFLKLFVECCEYASYIKINAAIRGNRNLSARILILEDYLRLLKSGM